MVKLKIRINEALAGNEAFGNFLKSLPTTFNEIGTTIHKARNVLKIVEVKDLGIEGVDNVMVKRYHGLFWFQKLDYTYLRKPKCRKAFDNTAELRRRGFDSARNLAVVEVWNHGLFQYAFYVSELAKGKRLDEICLHLKEENRLEEQHEVVRQFARHLVAMHSKGILYRDMNGGNVICRLDDDGCTWHFSLIDTNRAKFFDEHQSLDLETCMRDIILMNPRTGIVEDFIAEYLKQRGLYSEAEAQRIREIQSKRHEKKHPVKKFFKRYKKQYYRWLGGD